MAPAINRRRIAAALLLSRRRQRRITRSCNRGERDNKSFYRLPAVLTSQGSKTEELSKKRREKWLANISRVIKTSSLKNVRICSDHFISGKPAAMYDYTHPDWAPTLNLGHKKVDTGATARGSGRYRRSVQRLERRRDREAATALLQPEEHERDDKTVGETLHVTTEEEVEKTVEEEVEEEKASQTDLSSRTVTAMEAEIQRLLIENRSLKEKLQCVQIKFDREFFKDDDEKVKYYTGLPDFTTLDVVFVYLEPHIPHSVGSVLSKFQHLVLTLIKLRLNLSHIDNGQRFGINKSSASRLFLLMIGVMYTRLKPLIYWPEREQLRETMPMAFRQHFGTSVVVIVDCFEVFLERPSNLLARTMTWSSYKHHNTVKFLIGIAPQGLISFISKGWGGRASDKHIMEQCGILNKLLPGDAVLADRGFDVADSVGMMGAELKIPAFKKRKDQLSGEEVEKTRQIANVRIHVERVIGSLRQKYTILQSTLPMDYVMANDTNVTTLDKICTVCCGLTNMCPSVVSFE